MFSVIGFLIVLFSSDAFGYIFVSLGYFIFNMVGGYSLIFGKLITYKNFKTKIIDYFTNNTDSYKDDKTRLITKNELGKRLAKFQMKICMYTFIGTKKVNKTHLMTG